MCSTLCCLAETLGGLKIKKYLLGGRLGPVVKEVLAFGSIVMLVVRVADGANGNGLDDGAPGQQVQDSPNQGGGPQRIAGEGLAPGRGEALRRRVTLVIEGKEVDVAELQVGEVRQDGIGQLKAGGTIGPVDQLGSRRDSGLIGGCMEGSQRRVRMCTASRGKRPL